MIRPIMRIEAFLSQPSSAATVDDARIAEDLADTLKTHRGHCVGMAANMIGQRKRIIAVVDDDGSVLVMLNPTITARYGAYDAEEGCLSLDGVRTARRYRHVTVAYEDTQMRPCSLSRSGLVAQAIQHEIDHCDGILI